MAAGHVGGGPGFVDKDESFGIEVELAIEPLLARAQDVGTILFDRVTGLSLRVIPCRAKKRCSVEIATVTPTWPSSRRNSSSVMSRRDPCSAKTLSRAGVPVLVELKRASDTRIRREVIVQMLDYAANGTAYWQGGRVAESFAASMAAQGRDPDQELATFLGGAGDPGAFWQQVDANFSAGRIKLVFVADVVPRELARVVEFLNEQMKADVRAVELAWFEGEGGVTALAPRVIGETERAQGEKAARVALTAITPEQWIAERLAPCGPEVVAAAAHLARIAETAGGHTVVAQSQAALFVALPGGGELLWPLRLSPERKGSVQLNLAYLAGRRAFNELDVRQQLYDDLVTLVGPLTTTTLNGYPAFSARKLIEPDVQLGLVNLLQRIRTLADG